MLVATVTDLFVAWFLCKDVRSTWK